MHKEKDTFIWSKVPQIAEQINANAREIYQIGYLTLSGFLPVNLYEVSSFSRRMAFVSFLQILSPKRLGN